MKPTLLILTLLALFGSAQAQNWIGLRTGYPLGVTIHYGIDGGLSDDLDLRINANIRVRDDDVNFGVGADALSTLSVQDPFELYIGGGPAIDVGGGGVLVDVHGLVGGEFRLGDLELDPFGIFAELALGGAIGIGRDSVIPTFGGAVGFNYHF